ncbi:TPA: hypothetical protein MNS50_002909 [Klebsiella pneumoniae]|uniref:hypothetical protein n=1 Tax=Klebsiella pneumoniae complex TaxID=3390273 RepID=UPI000E2AA3CB|nr:MULTISPECIES: hypothetical protein [Klebsiella]MCP6674505.1 hypothetical protein [Klebsiella pneumoniae]THG63253.1 hypothetical protein E5980_14540 [Klebsiella variicola]SVO06574.1 Uncharacterised protein [Klebsiella pneumoniae]VVL20250.1 Uncharacterised protein [Klebsiella pneumoniae]HBV5383374.1 hypothetical protein [Klebsiella pneumoniae]
MRKTCININGNRIQDVTPDSFSFSDEDFGACAAYNTVKASDYYNVVTLVHNGAAIGYCSYKFGGSNEDSENIFITMNIDSVFITQAYRGNGYSNFLASYVAFDFVNYVKDMTIGNKPYDYRGLSHFISDDGINFYERVLQIAYGERPLHF